MLISGYKYIYKFLICFCRWPGECDCIFKCSSVLEHTHTHTQGIWNENQANVMNKTCLMIGRKYPYRLIQQCQGGVIFGGRIICEEVVGLWQVSNGVKMTI